MLHRVHFVIKRYKYTAEPYAYTIPVYLQKKEERKMYRDPQTTNRHNLVRFDEKQSCQTCVSAQHFRDFRSCNMIP